MTTELSLALHLLEQTQKKKKRKKRGTGEEETLHENVNKATWLESKVKQAHWDGSFTSSVYHLLRTKKLRLKNFCALDLAPVTVVVMQWSFLEKTRSNKTRQVYKTFYWQQNNREERHHFPFLRNVSISQSVC